MICSALLSPSRRLTGIFLSESAFGKLLKTQSKNLFPLGETADTSRSFTKAVVAFSMAGKSFQTMVILRFRTFAGTEILGKRIS